MLALTVRCGDCQCAAGHFVRHHDRTKKTLYPIYAHVRRNFRGGSYSGVLKCSLSCVRPTTSQNNCLHDGVCRDNVTCVLRQTLVNHCWSTEVFWHYNTTVSPCTTCDQVLHTGVLAEWILFIDITGFTRPLIYKQSPLSTRIIMTYRDALLPVQLITLLNYVYISRMAKH